jgi:hypothetical protein
VSGSRRNSSRNASLIARMYDISGILALPMVSVNDEQSVLSPGGMSETGKWRNGKKEKQELVRNFLF